MQNKLGAFEQCLLLTVLRLGDRAHGLEIRQEMMVTGSRKASPGAIYTVLARLESRGVVESWISDETPESGGRKRKFYLLRPAGAELLSDTMEALRRLAEGTEDRLREVAAEGGGPAR